MADWTISDYAAWWGAVIASLAFTWNVVSALRAGPRIVVRVTPNMQMFPRAPLTGDREYVSIVAVNVGTGPTTITHCCGYAVTMTKWSFRRGSKQLFIVNCDAQLGNTVPHVLLPGEQWHNLADQAELQLKGQKRRVYLGVIHNQRKRPVYKRVKLDED
ncbi:MAG: hypothetical protein ACREQ8_06665 [Woeseiaceae bacterium]